MYQPAPMEKDVSQIRDGYCITNIDIFRIYIYIRPIKNIFCKTIELCNNYLKDSNIITIYINEMLLFFISCSLNNKY